MGAAKKSGVIVFCLSLSVLSLLSIFAIITGSSAIASQGEVLPPIINLQPDLAVTPSVLEATLYPDDLLTKTLWITNTGSDPLTYTIYEMSASVGLAGFSLQPVSVPKIDPEAQSQIASQGEALVIIYLRELPNLSPAYSIPNKTARAQYVYNRLLETASHSQGLFDLLESQDAQPQRLLTANAIAARLNPSQLDSIAANSQVMRIEANHPYQIIPAISNPVFPAMPASTLTTQPKLVEWNIAKIRADQAWSSFNITGTGAVLGIIDTGVMYNHPALVNSYRGNLGGGNFDHNYSWFDFVSHSPAPYDDNGHGTMGAGIVSGDGGTGNQIGVAPGADWIAVKGCTGVGSCGDVELHSSLQWMLAPTDLSGEYPDPSKAPDVLLAMWGGTGCDSFFKLDVAVLRAAGILPVFAPGGGGPGCSSVGSPADLPEALAAGATDLDDHSAPFSSRGPSCSGEIKPDLSAPGVTIRSSINDGDYATWSGTSLSAAHAAGAAALVISADSSLGPDAVEHILYTTALCIDDSTCTGGPCPLPNNAYGHGRIDAFESVSTTISTQPGFDLPWLSESSVSGTLAAGEGVPIQITFDAAGLTSGVYTGALGIASSDPITPFISVQVTLTVLAPCQGITDLSTDHTPITPTVGELVTFTGSASGTLPITFDWDFGDGYTSTGEVVTNVFNSQGIHIVVLTAENTCDLVIVEIPIPVQAVIQHFLLPLVQR
jgi:subtilisin family serine protease